MREILFRGKRIDNGEWVYGYYIYEEGVAFIYGACDSDGPFETHEVYSATVGQFTGKLDKNGTKIWEGDILETYAILDMDSKPFYPEVKWGESGWIANGALIDFQCKISEVVGNIHDNLELIKGK